MQPESRVGGLHQLGQNLIWSMAENLHEAEKMDYGIATEGAWVLLGFSLLCWAFELTHEPPHEVIGPNMWIEGWWTLE